MRQMNFALALLTAAALAACGGTGSSGGDQTHAVTFSQQVTFGDSLSDVGSYNVAAVKAAGGGKFTINGTDTAKDKALTGLNWTEVLAAELNLPKPCAFQTGLEGVNNDVNVAADFNDPITNHPECLNYAQGGARVFLPEGPGNKLNKPQLGELTVPVVTQVQNHLSRADVAGKFKGTELVTIMAGGNDVLMQMAAVSKAGTDAGAAFFGNALVTGLTPLTGNAANATQILAAIQGAAVAPGATQQTIGAAAVKRAMELGAPAAQAGAVAQQAGIDATAAGTKAAGDYATAHATEMVTALGTAGAQLAGIVKTQLLDRGAKYVIVNNLPDVANTPAGRAQPSLQPLIDKMVTTFNDQLKAGLGSDARLMYVDLYSVSKDQMTNPRTTEIYGLTNVTTPACLAETGTSLLCTTKTTVAGDVSHYMYADSVHPTPYEYWLITSFVLKEMAVKGWL